MTNVNRLLESLGMDVKPEGSQLKVDCPACDDSKKHLYVRPDTGVGYCHKCTWSPNPYKLIEKMTSKIPSEIMKMLEEFGLTENNNNKRLAVSNQTTKAKRKNLLLILRM